MKRFLCRFFGWHVPDKSLDINFNSHCKYCGKDITKIRKRWKSTDKYYFIIREG